MNKIVLIIFGIFITIALLVGLYNYSIILELKEDTTKAISRSESADIELTENIQLLKAKTDILDAQTQSLLQEEYDFLLFLRDNMTIVKSGLTGIEVLNTTKFSEALQYTLDHGNVVIMSSGTFELDSGVILENKSNVILEGQGSVLNLNGYSIFIGSEHYANNSNNQIRNFVVRNGTIGLEDSFRATFENMIFEDCESALEISNTNTWSEATKLENIYWQNCSTALTFKTPTGNATSSYENTALDRCYMNLYRDNSVGIMVEKNTNVSNGQWTNVRFWMHANKPQTQTGLHLEGGMSDTILSDVIFESFGDGIIYGIYLGEYSTTGPLLGEGTSFHGDFDSPIKNDLGRWIYSVASVFKQETVLNSTKTVTIHRSPLTICSFDANITIEDLSANEEVTVEIKLNFIDQTDENIILSFRDDQNYGLTTQDLFDLYPSQNVIENIEVTNLSDTEAKVSIRIWGTLR